MSLQFVFGPAGCGKSTYVQERLIKESMEKPKGNFLLIVPDQFTMQTQMDIVKRHPGKGILNIDVLSFGRLSYRVFSVAGKPEAPILDDTGKSLVLRRVASEASKDMPYIGKNLNKIGYIHEVKSQISEFMQYGLSVKDVENMALKVKGSLLKNKLMDMAVIYKAFADYNRDKFITSEETLDILCQRLEKADFVKDAVIVFDGFTGFTPIQERVILKLATFARKIIITFDLSAPETPLETDGDEKLFYLSRKGAMRLKTKAGDLKIAVDDDILLDGEKGRFSKNPEFMHLEKNLFRYPFDAFSGKSQNIVMTSCKDIDSEVFDICRKIYDLIRTGKYAYRDIAVVTGNPEAYNLKFENRMRELNMPVFIDKTNGIMLNPFTEYLKSALQILIKDYSYDAVFHYLRSGFTNFTDEEIDKFDRYITSLNIRGRARYCKPFVKIERGRKKGPEAEAELSSYENIRARLMEDLGVLERKGGTVSDYVNNLYEFLKKNNSYEKLAEYEAFFEQENNLPKAKEYSQIYKCIMELLDTMVSLVGTEEMDMEEFYKIFEAGISEIEVGTIPKNVDRIVVGDIERTRLSELKILFFAGVNDRNIPKSADKGGFFSVVERAELAATGYDMAPTPREEMFTQRLYLYMNLCKPTDRLYVSYAAVDTEGKGMRPSYLTETLKKLYPNLSVDSPVDTVSLDSFTTKEDSLRYYAGILRDYVEHPEKEDMKKLAMALYSFYSEEEGMHYEAVTQAAFMQYVAKPLSEEIVKLIYGSTIYASISRMEMFAKCAYEHFLRYGMGLKTGANYDFSVMDLGNIYHGVLDIFSAELEKRHLSWRDFTEEEGKEIIAEAVRIYCEDYEQGILKDDEQRAYTITKITRIMERTIDTLQYHIKQGKFTPAHHEYSFEREVELDNGSKMLLNGKIDRIDICEQDGKIYVKILDYKSGERKVDVTNIYYGIEQQLAFYMAEAVHLERRKNPGKEVIPSALLYYTLDNPIIPIKKNTSDEEIDKSIKRELRVDGLFENSDENLKLHDDNEAGSLVHRITKNKDGSLRAGDEKKIASAEEFEHMLNYVEELIKTEGKRITAGDIGISPISTDEKHDSCTYCEYKAICRFDEKIPGYKKRDGKDVTEEVARKIVMGGNE